MIVRITASIASFREVIIPSGTSINIVANMDTGVDVNHPDLKDKWRGGSNSWFDTYGEHTTPYDPDGHGTMVAGIIAGQGQTGVARDVKWIAVKMYADSGGGTVSDVHRGFQWLLNPDGDDNTDDAPDIINNSWNIESTVSQCIRDYDFEDVIRILEAEGIALVFTAGNQGQGGPQTGTVPGTYEETFAVGSVDEYSNISDYSGRGPSPCYDGPFPNLVAPGQDIVSTFLSDGGSSNYFTASGTSFAAPHVAGAMALLMSALPNATPDELESALEQTTVDRGAPGPDYDYGHGLLDVAAAYEFLKPPPSGAEEVLFLKYHR